MDTFNINILPEENSVNITQGEPANISISQEVVQIAKIDESVNLEFFGDVTEIDANYPEALAAAQTAIEKAAEIEQIVEQGTADFNANAAEKHAEFNANAVAQTQDFDEHVADSINEAKSWAIGEPVEPMGNSAKYWAEQAASSLSGLSSRVDVIEGKIPSAASSSNQLADKDWVESQEYITGITSSDIITALGYTPYNSSNPAGYTSNLGTVTSVNNTLPDESGNVAIDALPIQTGHSGEFLTTDGINAGWAAVPSRNVGEIVASTIPLTDAGLHLLDGGVIQGGGAYGAFVNYIAGLVSTYPTLFTTETDWLQSVSDYGVCGKFVYDSANNTVRLPLLTGFSEATIDATVLGDLVEAGLPNITATYGPAGWRLANTGSGISGAFYCTSASGDRINASASGNAVNLHFDASRANSIYGNSTIVQPQAIKVLYYIVIASSTKTNIEVDIDEVMTDLNGKVDTDLHNITVGSFENVVAQAQTTGKGTIVDWGMPDYTAVLSGVGNNYTAPSNGIFWFSIANTGNTTFNIYITTTDGISHEFTNVYNGYGTNGGYPVLLNKGEIITIRGSSYTLKSSYFIPLKGVENA